MIKILTIANSFANNATQMLPDMIASGGGREVMIGKANLGGCSLEKHCNILRQCELFPEVRPYDFCRSGMETIAATLRQALQAERWDYVSMQQASRLSWQPDSFEPYFGQLVALIKELAPQAQPVIHQTWAYRIDAPFFEEHGIDQATMHAGILKAYGSMAEAYGFPQIPVGQAFANARQALDFRPDPDFDYESPAVGALPEQCGSLNVGWKWVTGNTPDGNAQFTIDAAHCSALGQYLGAAVWYEAFCGKGIAENSYRPDWLPAEYVPVLKEAAHQALDQYGTIDDQLATASA